MFYRSNVSTSQIVVNSHLFLFNYRTYFIFCTHINDMVKQMVGAKEIGANRRGINV